MQRIANPFILTSPTRLRMLITDVSIGLPQDAKSEPALFSGDPPGSKKFKGLWDTGCTRTTITQAVADALSLKPFGTNSVNVVGGTRETKVYFIGIGLPNGMGITWLATLEGTFPRPENPDEAFDVLIGMDVIGKCDFAITNHFGKTCFAIQTPSTGKFDFLQQQPGPAPGLISRNAPCPCGSGLKYKRCCCK